VSVFLQAVAYIEITIIDDTIVESTETFMVKLIRVIGGARLGDEMSVVVTIPPNDSPFGRFGFEELMVNLPITSMNVSPILACVLPMCFVSVMIFA